MLSGRILRHSMDGSSRLPHHPPDMRRPLAYVAQYYDPTLDFHTSLIYKQIFALFSNLKVKGQTTSSGRHIFLTFNQPSNRPLGSQSQPYLTSTHLTHYPTLRLTTYPTLPYLTLT